MTKIQRFPRYEKSVEAILPPSVRSIYLDDRSAQALDELIKDTKFEKIRLVSQLLEAAYQKGMTDGAQSV
jgi:hypothetical protein